MKKAAISIGLSTLIILASALAGAAALFAVGLTGTARAKANLAESAPMLRSEGDYPYWAEGRKYARMENYTDAIMINTALYDSSESVIRRMMLAPHVLYGKDSQTQSLARIIEGDTEGKAKVVEYPRYWHGYLVFLRPLLNVFSYQDIRLFQVLFQSLLLALVLMLLSRQAGMRFGMAFMAGVLVINPVSAALSMQYAVIYEIILAAMLAILLGAPKWKTAPERLFRIFLFIGIGTAYFDFLTYPFAALGIPLITVLFLDTLSVRNQLVRSAKLSFAYCFGYLGMWACKWLLSWLLTGYNTLSDALEVIAVRTGGEIPWEENAKATFMMVVKGNLKILLQRPAIILGVCAVLFLVARIVFFGDRLRPDASVAAGILAVSLYPFAWYLVTKNHSYIHAPFTYRELSIFVYGLCAALAAVVVPGKGRAFRKKNADRKTVPENRAMRP